MASVDNDSVEMDSVVMTSFDPKKFGRVAVLMGGNSSERAVSLNSGTEVLKALLAQGVDAFGIDLFGESGNQNPIQQLQMESFDRVFIALHGPGGEDGTVQGALEMLGIPYTGSGVMASALAMDKLRCKQLWSSMDLATPAYAILSATSDWSKVVDQLRLPLMVKPAHEGSSIGMAKVNEAIQLPEAYRVAADLDDSVFAESWISGREYTVAILDGQALPVIRLETPNDFYDYDAKYQSNDTDYYFDTELSTQQTEQIQQLAKVAFNAVGCRGWGRVDVMQDKEGKFWLLEVNTIPGMTDHSLVPMAGKRVGMSFEQLVVKILATTL